MTLLVGTRVWVSASGPTYQERDRNWSGVGVVEIPGKNWVKTRMETGTRAGTSLATLRHRVRRLPDEQLVLFQ